MIKRFNEIYGINITKIDGQSRFAYAVTEYEDFYDVSLWEDEKGYRGAVIMFYDLEKGTVYTPFEKERNITYGKPIFDNGFFFFLKGDFNKREITLYRYLPENVPEAVTVLNADETELYNLSLMGEGVNVISQGDRFNCYYPQRFSFPLQSSETAVLIRDNTVFTEAWIEEGWDSEKDRATYGYRFYNKVFVKDFEGKTLSEEIGSVYIAEDGKVWIS
ncbi:MAG: hypothetical protein IKX78_05470 [Clostridia bacterium]|nr:hypothetical protein [Clostridia bacterium]